jgi:hypothetical protein
MENKLDTKDSRMYGLMALYKMHTDFLAKAVNGIPNDAAQNRLGTEANHVAWLTGSLVQQRFEIAAQLGKDNQQAHHELFSDYKGIQEGVKYPPLADFIEDWNKISPILHELFSNLDANKLDAVFEEHGMKMSYFELFSFMIYREANIIGQIALWRRLLGYPALKYD